MFPCCPGSRDDQPAPEAHPNAVFEIHSPGEHSIGATPRQANPIERGVCEIRNALYHLSGKKIGQPHGSQTIEKLDSGSIGEILGYLSNTSDTGASRPNNRMSEQSSAGSSSKEFRKARRFIAVALKITPDNIAKITSELARNPYPNLESISISGNLSINQIVPLFKQLEGLKNLNALTIKDNQYIDSLTAPLPKQLKEVVIKDCGLFRALRETLPKTLESLTLKNLHNFVDPPKTFPLTLKKLSLEGCSNPRSIPESVPDTLVNLSLKNCSAISLLNQLPQSLEKLDTSGCEAILQDRPIPLPHSLKELIARDCVNWTRLPFELPDQLQELDLSHGTSLLNLPIELPNSLRKLAIRRCVNLQRLPAVLPQELRSLDASTCKTLSQLPTQLPPPLETFKISRCNNIRLIDARLPDGLTTLDAHNCERLMSIGIDVPYGLKNLNLSNCPSFAYLPTFLPTDLNLNVNNCPKLINPNPIRQNDYYRG